MIRTPIIPTGSSTSTFSFWSNSSTSTDATSRSFATTSPAPHAQPESERISSCKLVWGIRGKNFKPGMLFVTNAHEGAETTGTLLFFPMGKSFKTPCVDEPTVIIDILIESFEHARNTIPKTSLFSSSLNDRNYQRLKELRREAELWEECGEVEAILLTKGQVIQNISGDVIDRLLRQPNIFHILSEAVKVFSCTQLGITSPTQALSSGEAATAESAGYTVPSPFANKLDIPQAKMTATISPSTDTSTGSNWLYLEKHVYYPVLQHYFSTLLPCDPILSLPSETFSALAEKFSEAQLSLNMWFAPYNREDKVFPTVAESLTNAVSVMTKQMTKVEKAKKRNMILRAADDEIYRWIQDANELRRLEHEFNVWNLGLQRCATMKVTQ
ncbi:hypothetical protein DFH27DRAFT_244856 [Peziza echinospora]|nr:hypothetical protein DFH27DRAFT_244856 [Peziza echinospora]